MYSRAGPRGGCQSTGFVNAHVEDFLGSVEKQLIRQGEGHLELSLTRETGALRLEGPFGRLSSGALRLSARVNDLCSLKHKLSYAFSESSVRKLCSSKMEAKDEPKEEHEPAHVGLAAPAASRWYVDESQTELRLSVPFSLGGREELWPALTYALNGWLSAGMKTVASVSGGVLTASAVRHIALLAGTSKTAGFGAAAASGLTPLKLATAVSFLSTGFEQAPMMALPVVSRHVGLISLTSAMMFVGSIHGLSKHSTAQQGNFLGMLAAALGVLSVCAAPGFNGEHMRLATTVLLASGLGLGAARAVQMEEMPQLVAGFHSFVGLAAVFCGLATYFHDGGTYEAMKALETFLGTSVGMLTFTGSVVAAGKLAEIIPGKPYIIDYRWELNGAALLSSVALGACFMQPSLYLTPFGTAALLSNTLIWAGLGVNMVLPVGGADMPVVVSLLNAFSGIATSAAGFLLSNNLLTITGALVASSGTLLSDIMCRGINRSMVNVLMGGFGTDSGNVQVAAEGAAPQGRVQEVSADGFVGMLLKARRVLIVPGYGMAVARCQTRLADIVSLLRRQGVLVHFGIHPVAGRLPGHMNVLLAEASVPYDIVKEMDEINPDIKRYDVAIVVGANDIVNPATQSDPTSPIYGMPAIEVWEAASCVVLKRSMATGYSGVDNPLFYKESVRMLFGNAKSSLDSIFTKLEENQGLFRKGAIEETAVQVTQVVQEEFPPASKVIGIIRERRAGEHRVSIAPVAIPKLRRMGFSVLLEAGAGVGAGFADEDYIKLGGVTVAESTVEVLQQADIVLKVNEPYLDEVQVLKNTQTMVAFWSMFDKPELMGALEQSSASFVNLSLVPRVSRAQELDALTSMANIAGYRAVLDAFHRLPRFSRSSVTASGTVAPAKVFVIGAGIAGLSAIATASAMGAKVLANDVREAAREQVEGMGAEFVPVDAVGIAGEGLGGYATEVGEDFTRAQLATYARIVKDVDVVITTALIPNRRAPELITANMLSTMRRGAVIVDLAAAAGGNCALTEADKVVTSPGGVIILGETNYPSQMPGLSSEMISHNFAALLKTLGGAADFGGAHWEDPIIRPATVVRGGQMLWPPPAPPARQTSAGTNNGSAPSSTNPGSARVNEAPAQNVLAAPAPPGEVSKLVAWLQDHRAELALGVGTATILGLGIQVDIPEDVIAQLGYFVLSCLIGHFTVAGVTPALHTPLISVTNAISGVIVVGGMLQLDGPILSARVGCALAAVFLSTVNVVGGFAVTQRMLEMFREDDVRTPDKGHGGKPKHV